MILSQAVAKHGARTSARRALRRAASTRWWLVGSLVAVLLISHDAAMAVTAHGTAAARAAPETAAAPPAHVVDIHERHALASTHDATRLPSPANQPCLTSQSGVGPAGTDAPDPAQRTSVGAGEVVPIGPPQTASAPAPPLSPAVRRALLQVYLN